MFISIKTNMFTRYVDQHKQNIEIVNIFHRLFVDITIRQVKYKCLWIHWNTMEIRFVMEVMLLIQVRPVHFFIMQYNVDK